jgi:hypothetical protein
MYRPTWLRRVSRQGCEFAPYQNPIQWNILSLKVLLKCPVSLTVGVSLFIFCLLYFFLSVVSVVEPCGTVSNVS